MARSSNFLRLFLILVGSYSAWHLDVRPGRAYSDSSGKKLVLVTGAGGRTGRLVVEKLAASDSHNVRALVRSEKSKAELLKKVPKLQASSVYIGDITDKDSIAAAFAGVSAVIVVTSAVPKLKLWSLVPFMLGKLFKQSWKLRFGWKGGKPEQVDWLGQRNQFDLAKDVGAHHIVLVGTMTGTMKDSFLNSIGEGKGDNIVRWKRQAEVYLVSMKEKGAEKLKYTIIHAGGLGDAAGGVDKVTVGVDDTLRLQKPSYKIQRADVAEACVQSLDCKEAWDRSFDLGSTDAGIPLVQGGLAAILAPLKGANCDYSINPPC